MECFKYEPIDLKEDSFRFVRLFKGKDGPIRCELFHARLHDVKDLIEYEALSYTWGDADEQHDIEFNGRAKSVRNNLFLALTHLRHQLKDRYLWIDAICINQENIEERGHQVRQMASIYQKAERVVIWLGQATDATDLVLRSMQRLANELRKYAYNNWNASDRRWREVWSTTQRPLHKNLHEGFILQQREGLETLLCRPWFQRVWIIQEVANARSAEVVCGTESVSARIFAIYPSLLGITPDPHCQAILDIMPGPSRKSSWWTQNRDLYTLLLKFRGSKASDLRDIVYALLGISSDGYNTDSLVPDYNKSIEEVVHDTLAFLLNFRAHGKLPPPLPDWTLAELLQNLDTLGNSVFVWAVEGSYRPTVENLVHREDVEKDGTGKDGQNLIWKTAKQGNKPILELLLEHTGAHHRFEDDALFSALKNGDEQVCKLLFDSSVNIHKGENYQVDAIHIALKNGNKQMAELLLSQSLSVDLQHIYYNVALLKASRKGYSQVVELLLEKGADVNVADNNKSSPLDLATKANLIQIVKLLLEKGADPNVTDDRISSPLHLAVKANRVQIVRLLLEKGANPDIKNSNGETPLHLAAKANHVQTIRLLLEQGANPDIKNSNGETLLHLAAKTDYYKIIKLLREKGANPNDKNSNGETLLHLVARTYRYRSIKILLEKGANPNVKNSCGDTLLHLAAKILCLETFKLLQENGADPNVVNDRGETPLQGKNSKL